VSDEVPYVVERVPVTDTYPLRALVLRGGAPLEAARFSGDDQPDVAAFAVRDASAGVVGCVTVLPEACPDLPDHTGRAWRIRGMATAPEWRGRGMGTALLAAALDHVHASGGGPIWCNARTPARSLYGRAGFRQVGDEWVDPDIGPHVRMWRPAPPSPDWV
jgi:predicted GNAT family N-acyltransferase